MYCCDLLDQAMDRGVIFYGEKGRIDDGRILNDLDTEYFIRAASERGYNYFGINYCPFCGRPLSHGLWVAEKKK
jgi:hypothetical protein